MSCRPEAAAPETIIYTAKKVTRSPSPNGSMILFRMLRLLIHFFMKATASPGKVLFFYHLYRNFYKIV